MADNSEVYQETGNRTQEKAVKTLEFIKAFTDNCPKDFNLIAQIQLAVERIVSDSQKCGDSGCPPVTRTIATDDGTLFQRFSDWLQLSAEEKNNHKNFLEENYSPEELQLAYDEYFARYGIIPTLREFRVFILQWQGRRRKNCLVEMNQKVQDLEGENSSMNLNQENFRIALDHAVQLSTTQQNNLENLITDHNNLQIRFDQVLQAASQLQQNNEHILSNNNQLQMDCSRLVSETNQTNSRCNRLRQDNRRKDFNITVLDKENVDLHAKISKLDEYNTQLDKENVDLHIKNTQLDKEVVDLHVEISKLDEQNTQLDKDNVDLHVKNSKLDEQNTQLDKDNVDLHVKNSKLDEQNTQLDKEVVDLHVKNSKLDEQNTQLDKENFDFHVKNSKLDEQNTQLDKENVDLHVKNSKLDEQNTQLDKEVVDLHVEISKLDEQNLKKECKIKDLKSANNVLYKDLTMKSDLCEQKDQQIRKQCVIIDELENQISVTNERIENIEKGLVSKDQEMTILKNNNSQQSKCINEQGKTVKDLTEKIQAQDEINRDLQQKLQEIKLMLLNQRQEAATTTQGGNSTK